MPDPIRPPAPSDDRKASEARDALAALPSLGRTSARMLIEAGVPDVDTLHRLGPIEAYRRLRFRHGSRVTLNFVYALECAIRGLDWRTLDPGRKARLAAQARAVAAELSSAGRSAVTPARPPRARRRRD